jgi:ribosomal protein S18 acetylase RimI-like enzyme
LYRAAVDIASLAFRTDLAMLEHSGSVVEDRGTHLVVRTRENPTYWWGNFLLLPAPPADTDQARAWLMEFEAEFPEARHRTFGIDGVDGGREHGEPFAELGLDVDALSVMTATAVHEPPRPNLEATYRPLESDADWLQQVELARAGESVGYDLLFVTTQAAAQRRLGEAGLGTWWGAFEGGRLLSSMGLFRAPGGLARFQTVKTHPEARGRGLAGTLVHRGSRYGLEVLGAHTLVMVADPEYIASRIYRSVGFVDTERQLQAERKPQT